MLPLPSACVSIQFAALNATKRHFARQNGSDELKYRTSSPPYPPTISAQGLSAPPEVSFPSLDQLFIAGAAAGLSNSIVSGPVEHIRIRKSPFLLLHFSHLRSRSDVQFLKLRSANSAE
jgi:hypothetical protein